MNRTPGRWPAHGYIGATLVVLFWILNWSLEGTRTSWCFFPLWLGYSLVVDAAAFRREGSSLLTRDVRKYLLLFPLSALSWWFFELLNMRLGNWSYSGREMFSDLHFTLFATASFSTVMPAVFGTAALLSTLRRPVGGKERGGGVRARSRRKGTLRHVMVFSGVCLLALMLAWPRYLFPLAWVAPVLIVDALNGYLGNRTISSIAGAGHIVSLASGALICGFFWEMWNFYSFPKWIYHIPFVSFWHVFEMPLAGYGGYLPFGLELWVFASLAFRLDGCAVPCRSEGADDRRRFLW